MANRKLSGDYIDLMMVV